MCSNCKKYGKQVIISVYLVSFLLFELTYFGKYQEQISARQNAGAKEAIEYALTIGENGEDIYIVNVLRHSQVLFYTKYPTPDYLESVEWSMEEDFRDVVVHRFGRFCWDWNKDLYGEGIYIIQASDSEKYVELGYDVTQFQSCAVAVK